LLRAIQSAFLNKDSLTLAALSSRMKRTSTERNAEYFEARRVNAALPGRKAHEVRQVGARHAKGPVLFHAQPAALPKLITALSAGGVS
jgi:hypothetical protein